jgi:mannose-1-phosphate guanylyltransferase
VATWVLILAAGDGRRLQGVSRDRIGRPAPKQYCEFGSGRSLLSRTIDRALAIAPLDRVVCVVARRHETWWRDELSFLPARNVVVQPENRGTAAGILLPLLHIQARDPEGSVVVLPSDHHIEDEEAVGLSIREALADVRCRPGGLVLLGITPENPDTEYGWILPGGSGDDAARAVASFIEKPGMPEAERLLASGALWNSFMFAGRIELLVGLFAERTPELLAAMRNAVRGTRATTRAAASIPRRLATLYRTLESRDFSREILQSLPERLRVLAVPACGWSDLGTPDRLARVLAADHRGFLPHVEPGPTWAALPA